MSTNHATLFSKIIKGANKQKRAFPPEARTIVGTWKVEYAVRLRGASTNLHLKHVCVQTNHIGTCYYERDVPFDQEPKIDENLIGRSVLSGAVLQRWLRIAALDALYGNIVGPAVQDEVRSGTPDQRALDRATFVCDEVRRIASTLGRSRKKLRIVNVGVVGDFLEQLVKERSFAVEATDKYDALWGEKIHGVEIQEDSRTERCVAEADIALVTGMTLANGTIDGIFEAARENGTKLVLFAETGSNFAEMYLDEGAASVIAESYPFYLSGSDSYRLRSYSRE